MRRFHAGHGLGAGFLGGLVVAGYRPWLLVAAGVLLGAGVVLVSQRLGRLVRWLDRSVSPLTMRQWRALRRRVNTLRPDDEVPF